MSLDILKKLAHFEDKLLSQSICLFSYAVGTSEWRDKLLLNIVHGSAVTRSKKLINCTSIITLEHVHVTIGANNMDSAPDYKWQI